MGSVHHHQNQARRFLALARADHNAGDYARAANALARAASHAATAAVVHADYFKRLTRRRLTNYLFLMAAEGRISNGGVKTFRSIYGLSRRLAEADPLEAPTPLPAGPQPCRRPDPFIGGGHRRPSRCRTGPPFVAASVAPRAHDVLRHHRAPRFPGHR